MRDGGGNGEEEGGRGQRKSGIRRSPALGSRIASLRCQVQIKRLCLISLFTRHVLLCPLVPMNYRNEGHGGKGHTAVNPGDSLACAVSGDTDLHLQHNLKDSWG